jgi:hypothetical protein
MAAAAVDAFRCNVFVVGDSISMHFGPFMESSLADCGKSYGRKGNPLVDQRPAIAGSIASMHPPDTPPENGGDSTAVAGYLELLVQDNAVLCDVLVVNAGLHDIRVPEPAKDCEYADASGDDRHHRVEAGAYEANLRRILAAGMKLSKRIVWLTTTPVIDTVHNAAYLSTPADLSLPRQPGFLRFDGDRAAYARIAASVFCGDPSISLLDLCALTVASATTAADDASKALKSEAEAASTVVAPASSPQQETALQSCFIDHVHFNDAMRRIQGHAVASHCLSILETIVAAKPK